MYIQAIVEIRHIFRRVSYCVLILIAEDDVSPLYQSHIGDKLRQVYHSLDAFALVSLQQVHAVGMTLMEATECLHHFCKALARRVALVHSNCANYILVIRYADMF